MSGRKVTHHLKWVAAATIVIVTIGLFAWYISTHPEVGRTITSLSPLTLLLLTVGYILTVLANAFILYYSLRLLKKQVPLGENIVLTGYSSIVNFFGPLQSGPGFRAVYLKRMHAIKLRDFLFVSIVFYAFFGLINGAIIGVVAATNFGQIAIPLWLLAGASLAVIASLLLRKKYPDFITRLRSYSNDKNFWLIGLGALLLVVSTIFIYYTELLSIQGNVSIFQSIVYTAAANLALFVSLTPGALGIRESFLVLSQQLHGISSDTIIGASVIDRGFYVVFLLVMFLLLLATNVRKRLGVTSKSIK